jgi:polysaccharide biosynthesis transport protein
VDDTFDFHPYVDALLRRWRFIVGGTIVAGLLAVILSFLIPPTYETSALVLVTAPRQVIQFDPRFESVDEIRPLPAYPQLAASDHLLQTLLAQIAPEVTEPKTLADLRQTISVAALADPSLLHLTVRHRDPATAAHIANRWAELLVVQVNELLGDQGGEQVQFFIIQRDEARRHLIAAGRELADFQAANRARLVTAELLALEDSLALLLAKQQNAELLQGDIAALRSQLAAQEGTPLPADQIAVLLLYQRAFGDDQSASSIELQIDGVLLATADRRQLIAALDGLQAALLTAADNVSDQADALQPRFLTLQRELETLTNEEERLRQEAELATDSYTALARQVIGQEITAQDARGGLRLASPAIIAEEPVAPRKLLNGVLAAVVAFMIFVAVTIFRHWYSEQN